MKNLTILFLLVLSLNCFSQQHYPIKNMLGVNVHSWDLITQDPDERQNDSMPGPAIRTQNLQKTILDAGITRLRIYWDVGPSKSPDNSTYFLSPDRRGFRTDSAILLLKAKRPDLKVLLCYQGAPENIQADYNAAGEKNTIYVRRDADRNLSASYSELAHDMAVLTARGGTNKNVSDYPVYVPNNDWDTRPTMYKGADLYNGGVEPNNESDNNWMNARWLNGYQCAAMWSAVYDSVKKVDPNMIVSSGGLASDDTVLLTQVVQWSKDHGNKKIFDEYQYHSYGMGMSYNNVANGIPPERSTSVQAKKMVAIGNRNGFACTVGEWGYDANQYSEIGIIPFSNYNAEQIRAYWCARSILDDAKIGIKAKYYYKFYQEWGSLADSNGGTFATTSLALQNDNTYLGRNRLVGYLFAQFNNKIGDFVFDHTEVDNDSVKVYVFKNGSQYLHAGWTVEKITEEVWWNANRAICTERKFNYSLNVSGTRYDINEDSSGVFKQQPYLPGTVTLSSKPIFIISSAVANSPLPVKLISFTAEKINQAAVLKWIVQDAAKVEAERSGDGIHYSNLGEGLFNKLVDATPLPGNNYYRLKMYEPDGSLSYSPVRRINFPKGKIKVKVLNSVGQQLMVKEVENVEAFKASLKKGLYFLMYSDGSSEKYLKL